MENIVSISDRKLVTDLKAGSKYAPRQLINRYGERVYSLALERLKDPYEAETIYQDTFLQVVKKIGDFEFRSSDQDFKKWLFQIAANKIRDVIRKRKRDQKSVVLVSIDAEATDSKGGRYNPVQAKIDVQVYGSYMSSQMEIEDTADLRNTTISEFVNKLSRRDRTILECRACNLRDREIAEITGIPTAHVKVYFSRIKKRMIRFLQNRGHSL